MAGAKKDRDGLTHKQRAYARARAAGKSQIEAYAEAGYSQRQCENSQRINACKLDTLQAVQDHIAHLQHIADSGGIMDTEQRKAALYEIYKDDTTAKRDKLKALDMLNRMSGDYIDRKEISATVGITREDRREAMHDTLEALKKAWEQ